MKETSHIEEIIELKNSIINAKLDSIKAKKELYELLEENFRLEQVNKKIAGELEYLQIQDTCTEYTELLSEIKAQEISIWQRVKWVFTGVKV